MKIPNPSQAQTSTQNLLTVILRRLMLALTSMLIFLTCAANTAHLPHLHHQALPADANAIQDAKGNGTKRAKHGQK